MGLDPPLYARDWKVAAERFSLDIRRKWPPSLPGAPLVNLLSGRQLQGANLITSCDWAKQTAH